MSASDVQLCAACDKKGTLRCTKCRTISVSTWYCSTSCQKALWATHRNHCAKHDGLFVFPPLALDKEVTEFFNLFVRNRLYKVSDDPKAFEGNPEYNAIRTKIAQICTEPLSSLILSIDDRVTKGNIKPFLKDFLAKYETLNERSELWEQSVNNYALRDLAFNFRKLDYESLLVQPFAAYSQFHAIDRNLIGADGNQWLKDTSTFNFLMLDYQQTMVQPFRFLIGLGCLWKRVAKEAEKLIEEGKFDALKEGYDKFLVIRTNSYGTIGFSNSSSSSLL